MMWIVLAVAVNLVLVGSVLHFMGNRQPHETPPASPAPSGAATAGVPAAPAAEISPIERQRQLIEQVAIRVDDEIGLHTYRIEEISDQLRGAAGDDPEKVLAAAARILMANQRLQLDLASARAELQEQREQVEVLVAEARTDTLTGLPNRRRFNEDLDRHFDQWRRHKMPLCLLLIDVDKFKRFNDTYGHQSGDAILRMTAKVLSGTLRQMDLAARFGGEEFAVLLPGTRVREGSLVAERLRATLAAQACSHGQRDLHITVSIGVAVAQPDEDSASLIARADKALYAAKEAGRDCSFLHNGVDCQPIETDSTVVRLPFNEMQSIAPYDGGGKLPDEGAYRQVLCHDLSARGISFLFDEPPDFQLMVVRLGKQADVRYMVARVVNILTVGDKQRPQYRVGCSFVERLEADGSSHDAEAVIEPLNHVLAPALV